MLVRSRSSRSRGFVAALLVTAFGHAHSAGKPTNLVEAAGAGDLAVVQSMLAAGADVNGRARFQLLRQHSTPLIVAAEQGHVQVVRALIAAGADVNALDGLDTENQKTGTTALTLAAEKGHTEVLQALLAANANPDIGLEDGTTALMNAAEGGRVEVLKLLLAAKADPSPMWQQGGGRSALMKAMMAGQLEAALLLVEGGADVNANTNYSESALRLAARGNTPRHEALVKAMLARSVDVEAGQMPDYTDSSCGPSPARSGDPRLDVLLARERRSAEGSALGNAAGTGSVEIVQALLAAKANVNARQTGWQTPLMVAVRANRVDVVRLLLAAGADTAAKDACERTALTLATSLGHREIVALLQGK
jgi:ankyrin repeat protein